MLCCRVERGVDEAGLRVERQCVSFYANLGHRPSAIGKSSFHDYLSIFEIKKCEMEGNIW